MTRGVTAGPWKSFTRPSGDGVGIGSGKPGGRGQAPRLLEWRGASVCPRASVETSTSERVAFAPDRARVKQKVCTITRDALRGLLHLVDH